jgi:hypothetical protein
MFDDSDNLKYPFPFGCGQGPPANDKLIDVISKTIISTIFFIF